MNHKRLFRVYRQAGLSVKRTRHKKLLRIGIAHPFCRSRIRSGLWISCTMRSAQAAPSQS